MSVIVTGGAGFIGCNLVRKLLDLKEEVIVIDNLSSGRLRNLDGLNYKFAEMDLSKNDIVGNPVFEGVKRIYHLAANVDNRFSWQDPHFPITQNISATMNVGLAAAKAGIPEIIYASTGTIYGEPIKPPPYNELEENSGQTSLYGATKYAGEGILSVFSHHHGIKVTVFRFVGVLGPFYSHGHVFDFVKRLIQNPALLQVLGDGTQRKSYVDVDDVVESIVKVSTSENFEIFNLGRSDYSSVKESVKWVIQEMGISPSVEYQDSPRGWIGDNPFLQLDVNKIESMGFTPTRSIEQSVRRTVRWLIENPWILAGFDSSNVHR